MGFTPLTEEQKKDLVGIIYGIAGAAAVTSFRLRFSDEQVERGVESVLPHFAVEEDLTTGAVSVVYDMIKLATVSPLYITLPAAIAVPKVQETIRKALAETEVFQGRTITLIKRQKV